jgi:hypothetical protein
MALLLLLLVEEQRPVLEGGRAVAMPATSAPGAARSEGGSHGSLAGVNGTDEQRWRNSGERGKS